MDADNEYFIKLTDSDGDAVAIIDDTYTNILLEFLPQGSNDWNLVGLTPKQARKLAAALIVKAFLVEANAIGATTEGS